MEQEEVLKTIRKLKTDLEKVYSIKKIGIFGSFAKDKYTEGSDVDIVVELNNPTMFNLIGIKQKIEERLNRKVDIVRIRERMNKYLKRRIEEEAIYV